MYQTETALKLVIRVCEICSHGSMSVLSWARESLWASVRELTAQSAQVEGH